VNDPLARFTGGRSWIFRLFAKLPFIDRLFDFLAHEGERSRAETFYINAKAYRELAEVSKLQMDRLATLIGLMEAAGFSPPQIREAIEKNGDILIVSKALDVLKHHVQERNVNIRRVESPPAEDKGEEHVITIKSK
jgi:hypothetical protein